MTNTRSVTDPPLGIDKAHWYEEMIIFFIHPIYKKFLIKMCLFYDSCSKIYKQFILDYSPICQ